MTTAPRDPSQTEEKSNSHRHAPSDVQMDEDRNKAPGDPDAVARKHVDDVLKTEDVPAASEPSQNLNVND